MTERDEHFQGYAEFLYLDLTKLFVAMYSYRVRGDAELALHRDVPDLTEWPKSEKEQPS